MDVIIEPGRADSNYWRDIWRYRELFQVLAWRDIAVRYKQTVIGAAWALIRPLLTTAVFTAVFAKIAGLPSEGNAPYALMVYVGMLPWTFFSGALSDSSNSLLANASLIGKVYFPRLIVPAAAIVVALVDGCVGLTLLAAMMAWYNFWPDWRVLVLPAFAGVGIAAALGAGFWATALNVKYRDFRYVIPFMTQLGLYVSPVGFSSQAVPGSWHLVYSLNPMVGVIDGFRWSLLRGQNEMDWPSFALSAAVACIFLYAGIRQFRRMERSFADII